MSGAYTAARTRKGDALINGGSSTVTNETAALHILAFVNEEANKLLACAR